VSRLVLGVQSSQIAPPKWRSFWLTFVYAQGLSLTYALVGVLAASSGKLIASSLQTPLALSVLAGLFVLFALGMLDVLSVQLPSGLQNQLNQRSQQVKGGKWFGAFLLGAFSALMVGPCVAPPLASVLGFIAQTHNMTRGALSLYALGMGMSLPLILIGVLGSTALPKTGGWMNDIKKCIGILLLALAIQTLQSVIAASVSMLLWTLLSLLIVVYAAWRMQRKWMVYANIFWGSVLLFSAVSALAFSQSIKEGKINSPEVALRRLFWVAPPPLVFEKIATRARLTQVLQEAKSAKQAVFIDVYADWCVACHELEAKVFPDPALQTKLRALRLIKLDVTEEGEEQSALFAEYGLYGPPALIYVDAHGKMQFILVGLQTVPAILDALKEADAHP
jgi:thioredoxin:protein disulfide reductase